LHKKSTIGPSICPALRRIRCSRLHPQLGVSLRQTEDRETLDLEALEFLVKSSQSHSININADKNPQ